MTMIVNLSGLFLIVLIVWWFWFYKPYVYSDRTNNVIEILVKDGVYQPANIEIAANHPTTLRFIRKDQTACAEVVIFDSLSMSQQLPLNQPIDIQLKLEKPGEYGFSCQMGMYKGKLIVK